MPLRTKEDHGQVVELRDIVPGRQDPRLFEVPGDCAKVDNIVKVLGGESRRGPEGGVTGIGERAGQQGSTPCDILQDVVIARVNAVRTPRGVFRHRGERLLDSKVVPPPWPAAASGAFSAHQGLANPWVRGYHIMVLHGRRDTG